MENNLEYPKEYLLGIELFNAGQYYEAHEAWEDIWRETAGEERLFYQGLIQAAAALLHHGRNNERGVKICIGKSLAKLESLPPTFMSLDLRKLTTELREFFAYALEEGRASSKDAAR